MFRGICSVKGHTLNFLTTQYFIQDFLCQQLGTTVLPLQGRSKKTTKDGRHEVRSWGEIFSLLCFSEHHIWVPAITKSIALARIAGCATHREGVVFVKSITVPRPKKEETWIWESKMSGGQGILNPKWASTKARRACGTQGTQNPKSTGACTWRAPERSHQHIIWFPCTAYPSFIKSWD